MHISLNYDVFPSSYTFRVVVGTKSLCLATDGASLLAASTGVQFVRSRRFELEWKCSSWNIVVHRCLMGRIIMFYMHKQCFAQIALPCQFLFGLSPLPCLGECMPKWHPIWGVVAGPKNGLCILHNITQTIKYPTRRRIPHVIALFANCCDTSSSLHCIAIPKCSGIKCALKELDLSRRWWWWGMKIEVLCGCRIIYLFVFVGSLMNSIPEK